MTLKIEEMEMNGEEFLDDEITNLCQLNNLDLNLKKEDINDFLNSVNEYNENEIKVVEEEKGPNMGSLGYMTAQMRIGKMETIKEIKDYSYLKKTIEKKVVYGRYDK